MVVFKIATLELLQSCEGVGCLAGSSDLTAEAWPIPRVGGLWGVGAAGFYTLVVQHLFLWSPRRD